MENFKCNLIEEGIHIQGDARNLNGESYPVSLLLSYEETSLSFAKGNDWAKEHGGAMPTRAQWYQTIQPHREEINALLKEAGKKEISASWYWTCEEYANDKDFAWLVYMLNGSTYYRIKHNANYVRAVSAFPRQ